MKKIKCFIKRNYKIVIGFLIGIIVSGAGVYATTVISSSNISYDNSTSGLKDSNNQKVTDMQTAIDVLYTKAKSSIANHTIGKNVFVAFNVNSKKKSVCIIKNAGLHCFEYENYAIEKDHMQQVFSDGSCGENSSNYFYCTDSDFGCSLSSSHVECADVNTYVGCVLSIDTENCGQH